VTAPGTAVQRRRDMVAGWFLASTSGAALLAYTFLGFPMTFTVPFVVFPSALLLVGIVLTRQGRLERLRAFSGIVMLGAKWGLIATLFYDAIRPPLRWIFSLSYDPFRAIAIFGQLMTGRPLDDPWGLAAGWTYHFLNGITFGVMFALMRPRGGPWHGLVWALVLQGIMMATYPTLLQARLDDIGFMMTGLVGHSLWGLVLGAGIRREGRA
jgi:hypothetical protein